MGADNSAEREESGRSSSSRNPCRTHSLTRATQQTAPGPVVALAIKRLVQLNLHLITGRRAEICIPGCTHEVQQANK